MIYDVVICGGGLAGLTLARQLKLYQPNLTVAVIDKLKRPLPKAACKVGESTVIAGARYLYKVLELEDYCKTHHIDKLGLRYFFPKPKFTDDFSQRPEVGRGSFDPDIIELQFDRGILENDLRQFLEEDRVTLYENYLINDIELSDKSHKVTITDRESNQQQEVLGTWVIDASGRKRILQRKLKLQKKSVGIDCSACWFRIEGRIDVDDLVPKSNIEWHSRILGNHPTDENFGRFNSTNHLMGDGYWVWLIPLSSGFTSIGIVTQEDMHPVNERKTYELSLKWLKTYEPDLAERLRNLTPVDFLCYRNYSYSTRQMLSIDRWATVGEAAAFPDPFFSPGTDSIAYSNSITCEAIRLYYANKLDKKTCEQFSNGFIEWVDNVTKSIQHSYYMYGDAFIMACVLLWDAMISSGISIPNFVSMIFKPNFKEKQKEWIDQSFLEKVEQFKALSQHMLSFFSEWHEKTKKRGSYQWIEYFQMLPFFHHLIKSNLIEKDNPRDDILNGIEIADQLAQIIFLVALEDVMPDQLKKIEQKQTPLWINARAISLDPGKWESDGLFKATTKPQDLTELRQQVRSLFTFKGNSNDTKK